MHPSNEEKKAFIMENTNYYYKVIPFGLKNVGATYQRLMNKVFIDQIRRIMEVYMHGIVTKTMGDKDYCNNLREIFAQIRKSNMYLNPEK